MGIFKAIGKFLDTVGAYEVTCKYCGRTGMGPTFQTALHYLQDNSGGCGRNCHEPIITSQPK